MLPYTGPVNQAAVNRFRPAWVQAEKVNKQCKASAAGFTTNEISDARIVQRASNQNTWTKLEWTLQNIMASIEVRVAQVGMERKGYEFRSLSIKLRTGVADPQMVRVCI